MSNETISQEATGFESPETPTEQIEDVVVALDEALQHCRANPDDMTCDCTELHSRICHTEIQRLFEHYERHEILTYEDIEESISLVLEKLSRELQDDNDETIQNGFQLLKERAREIKLATRRYVQTISKFFHIKKQQFRMEPQDFKDEFQKIDQIRRNAHNGLIEMLTVYSKTINELKRYGALEGLDIEEWHISDRFIEPSDTEGKVFVFAGDFLRNRDLVKDWAISAHMHEKLEQITEIQKGHST
jgi:hypothetical protein